MSLKNLSIDQGQGRVRTGCSVELGAFWPEKELNLA